MAIFHLPTGTYDTRAAFAFKGGSFRDVRHFAASAILVQHPMGDLLIDAGFGDEVKSHIAMLAGPYANNSTRPAMTAPASRVSF